MSDFLTLIELNGENVSDAALPNPLILFLKSRKYRAAFCDLHVSHWDSFDVYLFEKWCLSMVSSLEQRSPALSPRLFAANWCFIPLRSHNACFDLFGLRSGGFSSFVHSFIRYFEVPRIKTTTSRKWSLYSGSVNNFVIPFHIFLLKRHERGVVQRERLLIFSFPWPYLDPYPCAPRVSLISFFLSWRRLKYSLLIVSWRLYAK